jgi:hypothetical protein
MDAERVYGRRAEERVCGRKAEKESGHTVDVKAGEAAEDREQAPSRKGVGDAHGKASGRAVADAEAANWGAVGTQPREAEAPEEDLEVDSTWRCDLKSLSKRGGKYCENIQEGERAAWRGFLFAVALGWLTVGRADPLMKGYKRT